MPQYPTSIDLELLTSAEGLVFRSGRSADWFGLAVSSAGDVNGDGVTDFLFGAPAWHVRENRPNPPVDDGRVYLVFGGSPLSTLDAADGTSDGIFDLSFLTPTTGYEFRIGNVGDATGASIAAVGNIDGVAGGDFLIGSPGISPGVALISGGANLAALDALDSTTDGSILIANVTGAGGYRFQSPDSSDRFGIAVDASADLNGDGVRDLLLGAYLADQTGATNGGQAALIFGNSANLASIDAADGTTDRNISLSQINGTNGYLLQGSVAGNNAGFRVEGIRDVNGDGVADILVGAFQDAAGVDGETYLLFGGSGNLATLDAANGSTDGIIDITDVNGTTGYRILATGVGDRFGLTLSAAGDVNGDGIGDFIIGDPFSDPAGSTNAGDACLVFGGAANLAALDLADGTTDGVLDMDFLNGTTGYIISGTGSEWVGQAVDAPGDVDGDGFDDLLIGANFRAPQRTGAVYVFFGGGGLAIQDAADGVTDGRINTSAFSGQAGFRIDGVDTGDQAGFSVAGLGDITGDGLGDIMIGSVRDQTGIANVGDGEAYIVYSRLPDAAVTRTGSVASQTIIGGAFVDTLSGLGGNDRLIGNAGGDTLQGGTGNDTFFYKTAGDAPSGEKIEGGDDTDTISIGGGAAMNFSAATITSIERVATESGGGSATFSASQFGAGEIATNVTFAAAAGALNVTINLDTDTVFSAASFQRNGGAITMTINGDSSAETITGWFLADTLNGGGGDDKLNGGNGNDTLNGGEGNDNLTGAGGIDIMNGGAGNDIFSVNHVLDQANENPGEGTADRVLAAVTYTLGANVERLSLLGSSPIDGTGNTLGNVITGNSASNVINGREGNDVLTGGGGADTFVFNTALASNLDNITDFAVGVDKIRLDSAIFTALTAGSLAEDAFRIVGEAADAEDRIVYNSTTGGLFYDADGGSLANGVRFATLATGLSLSEADFVIV